MVLRTTPKTERLRIPAAECGEKNKTYPFCYADKGAYYGKEENGTFVDF
jgi:hypothetical protein